MKAVEILLEKDGVFVMEVPFYEALWGLLAGVDGRSFWELRGTHASRHRIIGFG